MLQIHLSEQNSKKSSPCIVSGDRVHLFDRVDQSRDGIVDNVSRVCIRVQLVKWTLQGLQVFHFVFGVI